MSDDIDILFEAITQQERADVDRKHGEHILGMVADVNEKRAERGDPLLDLLEKAHSEAAKEDS